MSVNVTMPKLGMTMKEGKVAKWYKNEGDLVEIRYCHNGSLWNQIDLDDPPGEVPLYPIEESRRGSRGPSAKIFQP